MDLKRTAGSHCGFGLLLGFWYATALSFYMLAKHQYTFSKELFYLHLLSLVTLLFHTDYRSPKIQQIQNNNIIAWLFYDAKSRIQLRLKSIASIHYQDDIALKRWHESRVQSRKCYLVQPAPSSIIESPTDGLPEHFDDSNLTEESVAVGYENFAVVKNIVTEIDWLFLNHDGHRRAQFILGEQHTEKYWVIP